MTSISSSKRALLSVLFAAGTGIGIGCVISVSEGDASECGSILSHSHETSDGCECDDGYQFVNPDPVGANDFECEQIPGKPAGEACTEDNNIECGNQCCCDDGFEWCNPADETDLTCCEAGGTAGDDDDDDDDDATGDDDDDATGTAGDDDDDDVADDTAGDTGAPVSLDD